MQNAYQTEQDKKDLKKVRISDVYGTICAYIEISAIGERKGEITYKAKSPPINVVITLSA